MCIPNYFVERRITFLHQLIRANPLSTIITLSSNGLNANHIPLHLYLTTGSLGRLRGHVARDNPILNDIESSRSVLAIFNGQNTYITPSCYPNRQEIEKDVPAWNFEVVHVYGTLRSIDDPSWLRIYLSDFATHINAKFVGELNIDDAPSAYMENLISATVGVEIIVTKIIGKRKISPHQSIENKRGVCRELHTEKISNTKRIIAVPGDFCPAFHLAEYPKNSKKTESNIIQHENKKCDLNRKTPNNLKAIQNPNINNFDGQKHDRKNLQNQIYLQTFGALKK